MWNALPVIHTLLYLHDVQVLLKLTTKRYVTNSRNEFLKNKVSHSPHWKGWTVFQNYSRQHSKIFIIFFKENKLWQFMWIICYLKKTETIHMYCQALFSLKNKTFRILSHSSECNLRVNSCPAVLNPDIPCLCKQCRSRSASEEAKWSESALFVIQYVNLYQQPGSIWWLKIGSGRGIFSMTRVNISVPLC